MSPGRSSSIRGSRRRRADLRAAVSHRGRQRGAVELYAGRKMVYLQAVRRRTSGSAWCATRASRPRPWCRPCWIASCPCWRPSRSSCLRCGTWPTAARRSLFRLVRKALGLLPDVGFVNAYGLTETSSTIAVLTPTTTGPRWPRPMMRSLGGSGRSVSRYRASRCRSAARTAPSSARADR